MRSDIRITADMSCSTSSTVTPAVAHAAHQFHRAHRLVLVHARERFVEEQDGRGGCQSDGDAESPEMALGQIARGLLADRIQTQKREDLVGGPPELRLVGAGRRNAEDIAKQARPGTEVVRDDDIVADRHVLEDHRLLEGAHDALARHDVRGEIGYALTPEQDLSGSRAKERRDELEQRRLSRAVRADNRENLPFADGEVTRR